MNTHRPTRYAGSRPVLAAPVQLAAFTVCLTQSDTRLPPAAPVSAGSTQPYSASVDTTKGEFSPIIVVPARTIADRAP